MALEKMTLGEKIKHGRIVSSLTQKGLGVAVGLNEKTAGVRIAQYESGTRTPKEDVLRKIADVLSMNYYFLAGSVDALNTPLEVYGRECLIELLFDLDRYYGIDIHSLPESNRMSIRIDDSIINRFLEDWRGYKAKLANGDIDEGQYEAWQLRQLY